MPSGKDNMVIALDSNVFIAALSVKEDHSPNAQQLIRDIASDKHQAIASSIVFGEVYSVRYAKQPVDLLGFFSQIKNLATIPADDSICIKAGELRLEYSPTLKLPDAMHLATATIGKADLFVTNDEKLAKIAQKIITTKLLSQLP
jgi:predicted nucleic acid-binding protein